MGQSSVNGHGSTSGHLDSCWNVEADQRELALSPQVAKIVLCLTLILGGNIVVNQNLPGHLNINLNTNHNCSTYIYCYPESIKQPSEIISLLVDIKRTMSLGAIKRLP